MELWLKTLVRSLTPSREKPSMLAKQKQIVIPEKKLIQVDMYNDTRILLTNHSVLVFMIYLVMDG